MLVDKFLTSDGLRLMETLNKVEAVEIKQKSAPITIRDKNDNILYTGTISSHTGKDLKTWNLVSVMRAWRKIQVLRKVRDEVVFDLTPDDKRDEVLEKLIEEVMDSANFMVLDMGIPEEILEKMDFDMKEEALAAQGALNSTAMFSQITKVDKLMAENKVEVPIFMNPKENGG